MAEAAPKQSESMEDILQSIKRIIEDDGTADPKADAASAASGSGSGSSADVLELTQAIKDDGSVSELSPLPKRTSSAGTPATAKPAAAPPPPAGVPVSKPLKTEEDLVSDQTIQAAAAALKPVTDGGQKDYSIPHIPSSTLRNGTTVEDLLLEALRPMLKAWLDEHLPFIVQKIVEKEVKRLVKFHND